MKRKQAEKPYENYWYYKVWHSSQGRWYVNLLLKDNPKNRTTISYARYLMSVTLGRFLDPASEHVDHKDNDKSNDAIENLQILTPLENLKKQETLYREKVPKYTELTCPKCGKIFSVLSKNYRFKIKNQNTISCSRKCGATKY